MSSANDDVRDHHGLPPAPEEFERVPMGEFVDPDQLGWTMNFTQVCPKASCRQTVTFIEGQPLPHYCEVETYTAFLGERFEVPIIRREWIWQLCQALYLDPDQVKQIDFGAREVTITQYAKGPDGQGRVVDQTGKGLVTLVQTVTYDDDPRADVVE